MNKLSKTNEKDKTKLNAVVSLYRACASLSLPCYIVNTLNYYDLLLLVVEQFITQIEETNKQKERQRQSEQGREVRQATNDDIIKLIGR